MSKLTKQQALKFVEGYNREVTHNDAQYKFRRGSYADQGGDAARRRSLRSVLEHGVPASLTEITIADVDLILSIAAIDNDWFAAQAKGV